MKMTMQIKNGTKIRMVEIEEIYNFDVTYNDVVSIDFIKKGKEAKEIEQHMSKDDMDIKHEYIVLNLENGKTATFSKGNVEIYIIPKNLYYSRGGIKK